MQGASTLSVALATCNGAHFIEAQLESIAAQTLRPHEIVIGDDLSDDDTAGLVEAFAQRHPGLSVHFVRNPTRLGSARNFESIVRRCTGSVVVFSDQDDVWLPQRLATLAQVLDDAPQALFAFSDGELIDGQGERLHGGLFSSIDFTPRERAHFASGGGLGVLLRHNVVTGAALAVRRDALLSVLPFEPGWIHDYFIALFLQVVGRGALVDEPLIRYRLHHAQQVGVARASLAQALAYARKQGEAQCRGEAEQFLRLRQRLLAHGVAPAHPVLAALGAKAAFLQLRAQMRAEPLRSPALLWRGLRGGDYRRFSLGWKQVVVDLLAIGLALAAKRRGL